MIVARTAAWTVCAVCAGSVLGAPNDRPQPKVWAEPKPDQALVYFIRPGGGSKRFVFADQTILAHLGGDSYAYAFLPPGGHLVWDEAFTQYIEVVPGQVYYMLFGTGVSIVPTAKGREVLESVKHFQQLDTEQAAKGSKVAAARYARVKTLAEARGSAHLAELPAPSPPPQTEGLLRVPAYSPVSVELAETVTSKLNTAGQKVAFRVVEDAAVDGSVWLRAGTEVHGLVVEAEHSGGNGRPGLLEVRVLALPGSQGAFIPAVGQLVSIGKSKSGAANAAGWGAGLLGRALVKGNDAELAAGLRLTVFTRHEAWTELAAQPTRP